MYGYDITLQVNFSHSLAQSKFINFLFFCSVHQTIHITSLKNTPTKKYPAAKLHEKKKMEIATTIEGESSHFFSKKLKNHKRRCKDKNQREKKDLHIIKQKNTPKVFLPSPKDIPPRPPMKMCAMS